jgi:predicted small secreted protein
MKILRILTFSLLWISISIGCTLISNAQAEVTTISQLIGIWKSAAPEDIGNGNYTTREFTFTDKLWEVEAVFYSDQQLSTPLFSFTAKGTYRLLDESSVVAGATNAVFSFSKKSVTLLSSDPAIVSRFNLASCNLVIGIPKDISLTGCSFFTSVSSCAQEFDLVKIEDQILRLGTRPADRNMCTEDKRPKGLGLPVRRKK